MNKAILYGIFVVSFMSSLPSATQTDLFSPMPRELRVAILVDSHTMQDVFALRQVSKQFKSDAFDFYLKKSKTCSSWESFLFYRRVYEYPLVNGRLATSDTVKIVLALAPDFRKWYERQANTDHETIKTELIKILSSQGNLHLSRANLTGMAAILHTSIDNIFIQKILTADTTYRPAIIFHSFRLGFSSQKTNSIFMTLCEKALSDTIKTEKPQDALLLMQAGIKLNQQSYFNLHNVCDYYYKQLQRAHDVDRNKLKNAEAWKNYSKTLTTIISHYELLRTINQHEVPKLYKKSIKNLFKFSEQLNARMWKQQRKQQQDFFKPKK